MVPPWTSSRPDPRPYTQGVESIRDGVPTPAPTKSVVKDWQGPTPGDGSGVSTGQGFRLPEPRNVFQ